MKWVAEKASSDLLMEVLYPSQRLGVELLHLTISFPCILTRRALMVAHVTI